MTVQKFLRQSVEPFTVPEEASLGVYRIDNGDELERVVKIKHVGDAAKLLRDLNTEDCWFMYIKEPDKPAVVIAMSEKMKEHLCSQHSS